MKIAIIGIRGIPANYSGFETSADYTSRNWAKNGHEVIVYCRKTSYSKRLGDYDGVSLIYIPSLNSRTLETLSHTLFSIIHLIIFNSQYKVIHIYNSGNGIFLPLLRLFRKSVIISVDGIEWKRDKWGTIAKRMFKIGEWFSTMSANKIVVDNEEVEKYYAEKYKYKTSLIAYGAKLIQFNPSLSKNLMKKYNLVEKEYFIFIGRLVPEKGVHNLIEAYNKLNTQYPLIIIGDDSYKTEYRNNLFKNHSDKIRFLGFIYDEAYEQLLYNALLYVSASHLEGTSPSLLSALGAKVCCLVNGIEENLNTVKKSAFTYRKNDNNHLAIQWQKLIDNPELIKEMSKKGFLRVSEYFNWENISKSYLNLFKEVK